jgi:succinate dehydrogenase / fumarate reductase membrane anchor subunit
MAVESTPSSAAGRQSLQADTPREGRTSRARPSTRGEFWWWMFMRISGILLLVLAVGHVLVMHVAGQGIDRVNFGFVAVRWQHPFWRTWDWLMLSLALLHGMNGLRVITLDYVRPRGVRTAINAGWAVIGTVLFALGTVVVFTFNACNWPGTHIPGCP